VSQRFAVEWTEVAIADLGELIDFIEQEAPGAGESVLNRLEQAAQRLETLAHRGRVVPELARFEVRLYRELVVRPWRIVYRVSPGCIHVMAVLDSRRDLEALILERLLRH